jgi:hypothetical protein
VDSIIDGLTGVEGLFILQGGIDKCTATYLGVEGLINVLTSKVHTKCMIDNSQRRYGKVAHVSKFKI